MCQKHPELWGSELLACASDLMADAQPVFHGSLQAFKLLHLSQTSCDPWEDLTTKDVAMQPLHSACRAWSLQAEAGNDLYQWQRRQPAFPSRRIPPGKWETLQASQQDSVSCRINKLLLCFHILHCLLRDDTRVKMLGTATMHAEDCWKSWICNGS